MCDTVCEAPEIPTEYVPSNVGKRLSATRLRALADWLERHEISDEELCNASTDGWDDMNVHLKPAAFVRVMNGRSFVVNEHGHAVEQVDGVRVVCVLK